MSNAFLDCASMRTRSVSMPLRQIHALNGEMAGPAVRTKLNSGPLTRSARPAMAPARMRPCPSRYLVAEWITRSAPNSIGRCSAGEHMQLSMASTAPAFFATSASAAMSAISHTGFDGVSAKSRRVSRRTALRHASTSVRSTQVVAMPSRARIWSKSGTTVPNTPRAAMMWSPDLSSPSAVVAMAAMPVAVATHACAPSSAASRAWNIDTVGLVKRE